MGGLRPTVTAVVVTYADRRALVAKTCGALLGEGVDKLVVVANGCAPDVVQDLQANRSIEVVALADNTGSAGGYYAGLARALEAGHEFIWLMDDDNVPVAGCLEKLLAAMETSTAAAMPMRSEPIFERSSAGVPLPGPGSFMYFDIAERLMRSRHRRGSGPVEHLAYAPYGGLLARSEAVRRAGMPDTDRVLYEDDSDFTERLVRLAGSIKFVPDASVTDIDGKWSDHGSIVFSDSPIRQYYAVRNRVRFDVERARSAGPLFRLRLAVNAALFVLLAIGRDVRIFSWIPLFRFVRATLDGWRGAHGIAPEKRVPNDLRLTLMPTTSAQLAPPEGDRQ